jgi:conjugative relaxase-like TrwC/TraI family protein
MLNVGKLARGRENYYLSAVARGAEDYYLGSGEAPGRWLGRGLGGVGLSGEVGAEQLRAVLGGLHPTTFEQLPERMHQRRLSGFDLTFRAPKSVSLLHALGNKDVIGAVTEAHEEAVLAALAYLEREACGTRRGPGGVDYRPGKGFVAAGFRHRTSRAGDPLLHTHVLVANMTQTADGRWGALDGRRIYTHAKTAGYLYQAHLRWALTRSLGVEWTPVRRGAAEVEGVQAKVIRAFSKRRAEIEARLAERGEHSASAAQVATLDTRAAKDYGVGAERLRDGWRAKADRLGFGAKELGRTLRRKVGRVRTPPVDRLADKLTSPEGLTRDASSFCRRDVLQAVCQEVQNGAPLGRVEELADEVITTNEIVTLALNTTSPTSNGTIRLASGRVVIAAQGEPRYSTTEMLAVEQAVIEDAVGRREEGVAVADPEALEETLAQRPSLSEEQRSMVAALVTSGAGVDIVVGKAGTGKTFALEAARDAWVRSGHRVIGCSTAARAAVELETHSGIASTTITSLLLGIERDQGGGVAGDTVIVIDEAAMVGTRTLARLLSHAREGGAKVVLVGDDHQLPEIAAGGAFRGIKHRSSVIELSEVRRQEQEWERAALDSLRSGRAREAVTEYVERDRMTFGTTAEDVRTKLVTDWWEAWEQGAAVMLAARRDDVDDLNARARLMMRETGQLGKQELEVAGRSFAVGDRVMTTRNARRWLGVLNGTQGEVASIDARKGELTLRTDGGRHVKLPAAYLAAGHVSHAYALTGHKAQGMTTARCFALGDDTLYKEWGYTALSRGKKENHLYLVGGHDIGREEIGGAVSYESDGKVRAIRALSRRKAKEMASEEQDLEVARSLSRRRQ